MSGIAKIFIVVNVILAVMFTTFTLALYAKRVDYKGAWLKEQREHQDTKAKLTEDKKRLEAELRTTQENLRTAERTVKDLQARVDEMDTSLKSKEARIEELRAQEQLLLSKIEAKDRELNRRHNTIADLHKRIANQQQLLEAAIQHETAAIRMRIEAENQLKAVSEQLATVLKDKERVENDLAHAKWTLDMLENRGINIADIVVEGRAVPAIDGQVLAVDSETNLVMLSVGKDDDVEKGFHFSVYRGDEFVGKVRVAKVFNDMCAAVILDEFRRKDIQEGDHASTRLFY